MTKKYWVGDDPNKPGAGIWAVPSNWSPSGTPGSGDDVIVGGAGGALVTNAVPAIHSLEIYYSATVSFVDGSMSVAGDVLNLNRLHLDDDFGEGGSSLTVGGSLVNRGTMTIGNDGLDASVTVTAATVEHNGILELRGNTTNRTTHQATLHSLDVAGLQIQGHLAGDVYLSGDALLEFSSGQITTVDNYLSMTGAQTRIADASDLGTSSALRGLTSNVGDIALYSGAKIVTDGNLSNTGLIELDHYTGGFGGFADGGSTFDIGGVLTNSGTISADFNGYNPASKSDTLQANGLVNSGTIDIGGSNANTRSNLVIVGSTTGSGGMIDVDGHGDVIFIGGVGAGQTIALTKFDNTVESFAPSTFAAKITGFAASDELVLSGAVAALSYRNPVLTVTFADGAIDAFNLTGSFTGVVTTTSSGILGVTTAIKAASGAYTLSTGTDVGDFFSGTNTVNATAATLNATDRLHGGSGVDTLALSGGGTFNLGSLAQFSGFEKITAAPGANYTITTGNANVAAGQSFTVDTFALGGTNTLSFDGSAETDGQFNVTGGAGADTITTGAGADVVNGGAGADTMTGGGGNDEYFVDNAADKIFEATGGGADQVVASVSYHLAAGQEIEMLQTTGTAGAAAINLTGNAIANTLVGNAGANRLDGGGGADRMYGYGGDDYYYVDNAADQVFESAGNGNDRVVTSVSYTLAAGQEIETLQTTSAVGTTAIDLTGNAIANALAGNAGDNRLNGGGGADKMYGYGGNDTYYVDNAADQVFEKVGFGSDRVVASVSYTLAAGQEIETLQTTGTAGTTAIDLTGNTFANTVYGNNGDNVIDGKGGDDSLHGYGGHDTFVFSTTPNTTSNDPTVADFHVSGTSSDMIDLSHAIYSVLPTGALANTAFKVGSAATTSAQHVIYNSSTGALLYDADGSGSGAAVQFANLSSGLALTAGQFKVVA